MKKPITRKSKQTDDMRREYDFSKGVRGKHFQSAQSGYTMTIRHEDGTISTKEVQAPKGAVILEPDVQAFFPDAESVNKTLRTLIQLVPSKRKTSVKKQRA